MQADIWAPVRRKMESGDQVLMRQVRRLVDLPRTDAKAALVQDITEMHAETLRQLWALLVSAAHGQERRLLIGGQDGGQRAVSVRRRESCLDLAEQIKRQLNALGQSTAPVGVGSPQKLAAWFETSKSLGRLHANAAGATWTAETHAKAKRLLAELQRLRSVEPAAYLDADLGWAIGVVREGIAEQFDAAGELADAKRAYLEAAAAYADAGRERDARNCRLKLVGMIRRCTAGFDETISELNALLGAADQTNPVQQAEMRLALAQTYALVGDVTAADAQLRLATQEIANLGYAEAKPDDPTETVSAWIARADAACAEPEVFEAELTSLFSLHAAMFEVRSRIDTDHTKRSGWLRATEAFTRLGNELSQQLAAQLQAQSRERAAFVSEFGDPADTRFQPVEIGETRVAVQIAALSELNAKIDRLREEMVCLQEARAPMDHLLPEAERIDAEARTHDLTVVAATALLLRADILGTAERFPEAIAAARAAFDLPRPAATDLTTGLYALDRIIGVNIALQNDAAISSACGEAIDLIERYRTNVTAPYSLSAYLQDRIRYYTMGIDAAFRTDNYDALLQRAEYSKAAGSLRHVGQVVQSAEADELEAQFRAISEQIGTAEAAAQNVEVQALRLRRRTLWDLLSIKRAGGISPPAPVTLQSVCGALEEDEAVVYYYWLVPDVLLIIAIDGQRIRVKKQKITDRVRRAIDELAAFAQSVRESTGFLDTVQRFSRVLLPDEIRPVLEGKRRLIFSPHRILHALPLHALAWDGDLLIRRFAISYVPNLGCLLRYFDPAPMRLIAIGMHDFAVPATPLRAIEEAETEIDAIAAVYGRNGLPATTLRTQEATTATLRRMSAEGELARYSCLHLVTHGADALGDTPLEAHLFLYDGRFDGLEIATWRLSAELVVLGACHSGQRAIALHGAEIMSDDIFGLQAALFTAGAARVLGALWPVESKVAAAMMPSFHARLVAGAAPECALQSAILEHLEQGTPQTRMAYYWAPFFVAAVARPRASRRTRCQTP